MAFSKDRGPRTAALASILKEIPDTETQAELLFWERWELGSRSNFADFRRIHQLRRANPVLAAAFRAEAEPALQMTM